MLELLARYGATAEPGFAEKRVRWAVVLDRQGRFLDVVELGDVGARGNKGQSFPRCPEFERAYKQQGGRSEFLVDSAGVVALLGDDDDRAKNRPKHEHFVALLRDAAQAMPELKPAADALSDEAVLEKIRARLQTGKAKPTDKVTLQIDRGFPVESSSWHDWWRRTRLESSAAVSRPGSRQRTDKARQMICLVTGAPAVPLKTHPKIEGLADVGGLATGDVLVGFDKPAFQSYFLDQSANASVSEEAAYRYRAGLNELIAKHSQKLAGARVVHWFKMKVRAEDDPLSWFDEGAEAEESGAQHRARELLQSIREGRRPDLADNYYYAMSLSGAGGRVMVRDWMEGRFEELVENIGYWFDDLAIVHRGGGGLARDPKFLAVLGATVRDIKDLPPPFVAKMWRVAVCCEPIPQAALAMALGRFKADVVDRDKTFNHARMGLLKSYFVRQDRTKGMKESEMRPTLSEQHPSPAYHCGRMMAVLAQLQQAALGDVGAGVVQRYYAAASATPALVLGRLIRGGQFHLNKLEPGLARWFEEKLGNIAVRLGDSVPQTLTLEEQSLFALGYYQQLVDLRTKKTADDKKESST